MKILVLNSGSSSQKSCLYEIGDALPEDPPVCIWEGKIEWEDDQGPILYLETPRRFPKDLAAAGSREKPSNACSRASGAARRKRISDPSDIDVVGHRVVHGGPQHFLPAVVTAKVKSAIEAVSVFAPLHNRAELEGMAIVAKLLGSVPQIAVFDTGFHRHHAFSGENLSRSLRVVRAGNPPLRISRHQSSILRRTRAATVAQHQP